MHAKFHAEPLRLPSNPLITRRFLRALSSSGKETLARITQTIADRATARARLYLKARLSPLFFSPPVPPFFQRPSVHPPSFSRSPFVRSYVCHSCSARLHRPLPLSLCLSGPLPLLLVTSRFAPRAVDTTRQLPVPGEQQHASTIERRVSFEWILEKSLSR